MSIAFRSYAEKTSSTTSNTTIAKPSGTTDGDVLLAAISADEAAVIGPPAGWTEDASSGITWSTSGARRIWLYYKVASSEGADWQWTHALYGTWGIVGAWSGGDTGTPNDAAATSNSGGSDTSVIATGLTTATSNAMHVIIWTNQTDTGSITTPSGYTDERSGNVTFGIFDKIIASPGAVGNQTITSANNDMWAAFSIAIRASGAGASATKAGSLLQMFQ